MSRRSGPGRSRPSSAAPPPAASGPRPGPPAPWQDFFGAAGGGPRVAVVRPGAVRPGGAGAATDLVPIALPGPGRFSITTDCPSADGSPCEATRAATSVGAPGPNGTTSLMV